MTNLFMLRGDNARALAISHALNMAARWLDYATDSLEAGVFCKNQIAFESGRDRADLERRVVLLADAYILGIRMMERWDDYASALIEADQHARDIQVAA